MIGTLIETWRRLLQPAPSIHDADRRRQARLVLALLAVVVPVGLVLDLLSGGLLGDAGGWLAGGVMLALAYALNRRGRYAPATALVAGSAALTIFVTGAPYDTVSKVDFLSFLVVPVLLGSMLLSTRAILALAAAEVGGMWLLPAFFPVARGDVLAGPLGFVAVNSALVLFAN
jgi:hypothetical protein